MDPPSCLTLLTKRALSVNGSSGSRLLISRRSIALQQRRLFLEVVAGVAETSFSKFPESERRRRLWIKCLTGDNCIDVLQLVSCQDFAQSLLVLASSMKDSISDALLISSFFGKDVVLEVLHTYIQKLRTQEATPDSVGWTALRNMARYNPAFFQQSAAQGAHVRLLDDIAFLINLEISTLLTTHSDIWRSHMKSIAALQLSLICTLDVLEALCGMSVGSDGDEYFKIGSFSSAIAHSVVLLCLKLEPLVVDDRRLFGRTAKKGGARDSDDSDRSGDEGGGGDDDDEEASSVTYSRTYVPFAESCLLKACALVTSFLRLQPSLAQSAAPSDCLSWIKSPCWQLQHLCLSVIKTRLLVESSVDAETSRNSKQATAGVTAASVKAAEKGPVRKNSVEGKAVSSKAKAGESSSGKQRASSRLPSGKGSQGVISRTKTFDELCRSGFLRPLLWCLLHSRAAVRVTALQVVDALTRLAATLVDGGAELWVGLLEQGLVALLEVVDSGIVVSTTAVPFDDSAGLGLSRTFPEQSISRKAGDVLDHIAFQVMTDASLRSRAVSALVHTGSPRLRTNIFSGITFLSARSPQLGLQLWSSSLQGAVGAAAHSTAGEGCSSSGGDVFQQLVDCVYKDPSEMGSIISFMHHVLELSLRKQEGVTASGADSTANAAPKASAAERASCLRGGPTVAVLRDGSLVKMLCAAPAAVSAHSKTFASFLQAVMEEQQLSAQRSLLGDGGDSAATIDADLVARTIASSANSSLVELRGCRYDVWQEVFSHIVDDFLLEQSLAKMDVASIVEAYAIARKFRMARLGGRYASVLSKRLVVDNFADILEAALGLRSRAVTASAPGSGLAGGGIDRRAAAPHLGLCCACLAYLSRHLEKVLAKRSPARVGRVAELLLAVACELFFSPGGAGSGT